MEKELRAVKDLTPTIQKRDGDNVNGKSIVGYAVKWDQLSQDMWGFQEKFTRGAFTASLANRNISVYAAWNHNASEILGRAPTTLTLVEDDFGLRYEINPPAWAERYLETIERGDVSGSSFMFRSVKSEWDESNPDLWIRTVTEAELYEVSPVTTPAYPTSTVGVRSADSILDEYKQHRSDKDQESLKLRQKQRERELDILGRV